LIVSNCSKRPIYYPADYFEVGSLCKDEVMDKCYIVNSTSYYDFLDEVDYNIVKLLPSEIKYYAISNTDDKDVVGIYFNYTTKDHIIKEPIEISDLMDFDIIE